MLEARTVMRCTVAAVLTVGVLLPGMADPSAQRGAHLTSPREQFGHDIGDDYVLVNYTQYVDYLLKLDRESDRLTVVDIGRTAEGRTEYTAIITSPENQRRLQRIKDINRRLALGEPSTDEDARALIREAKAVVWIDGGLHATEVLGAQQLVETIYRLTSRSDAETLRILNDVVVLCTLVNPDGMELVSNWYMREPDARRRSTSGLPRLYQKYIGHDNNRDFYMMNQPESENANRILYREWFPAIMYNHHQTGPPGAVLFAPPFRDPFNYNVDPLVVLGIDLVGAAIHTRLAAEGKPGAVMRTAAPYSTWFNGGIRTTAYFHNQIGILTETIGSPTPIEIPFVPEMQLPRADVPNPISPQPWHFRQSVEYSLTNNYAILDVASKRRDDFLFNMYRMARNAIEKGSRDSWTMHPSRFAAVNAERERIGAPPRGPAPLALYTEVLHDPAERDARGYIVSAAQPDFLTAVKFVNTLIKAGVRVKRATGSFTAGGRTYPAGSFVVQTAQPFRAHVLDMFEPQDHPDDVPSAGGAPRPPYDVAGYTLAYSMGVQFDRILDAFDGPFVSLADAVLPSPGAVWSAPDSVGYLFDRRVNDAFIAVNRLLKAGEEVFATTAETSVNGRLYPAGTFFVARRPLTLPALEGLAAEKGLSFLGIASRPPVRLARVRAARIGLWDTYGGSMPSGWTRWLLEQFEFPFEVVFPKTLDAGGLASRFDALIFVDGAIPAADDRPAAQPRPETIPPEFRDRLGATSVARTVPALRVFVEAGGTLVAIGSSTAVGFHLGLPIRDALVERSGRNGRETPLPTSKFYVPGSLLSARVDFRHPLALGMAERADVFFDHSPAFKLLPEALRSGVRPVAWFDTPRPLRSGWAWGQEFLDQTAAVVDAPLGKGHVVLSGPEIAWRGQPHGTFKLLFNCLYLHEGD